ncbi:glycosyltransferase involved in cell wall biosynthesis/peptidoglycan/xylan/chitin deacetylase (PgdA/CDA1 family) [Geodermatophilus bullaregiensis]|uniref:glycosyltransferase n=1 Tax=Geodermatophilus bullaregiensis TaxID=1564160 RepID=UPI0027DC0EDF|nr:glycosyltransferase [Geodermatophilus bullaregiensis]MBM7804171.1 glycosyltransferase involved in cell wall biosynthesis/peptidoglycan/xylan/chitin deacetylase (PgdA/CDA1 family) [Geodermatophilus bullaregiensis]
MDDPEAVGSGTRPGADRLRFSVVLPTYQRRELVTTAVRALVHQTFDQPFEVIVTVDGSTDGTADALRAMPLPFPLTVLEQPNAGAAAARNRGARHARGDILLFLDDDMEAAPGLLAEHERSHRQGADAVLGHLPLHPSSVPSALSDAVAQWSEERLTRLSQPGAPLTLHDLLTGQLSVAAAVFDAIGGFDPAFTHRGAFGNEDVDFGHRLLRGGYDIRFNPAAVSSQRYVVTPRQHLRQWRQAGHADVLFARRHPQEALSLFELNGLHTPFARRIARPLARAPLWGLITRPVRALAAGIGDRRGGVPEYVFFRVRALEYWRGVSEAGGIPRRTTLRILVYHAISDLRDRGPLTDYGVPPEQFRRQLTALRSTGFHPITPEEFAAFAEGRGALPRRAVLLTFDDGYRDLLDAAAELRAEGVGAVVFAVTGLLGRENEWDRVHGGRPLRLLDAADLHRLREYGFEVGAHSRTHPTLPTLSPPVLTAEVRGSVDDLAGVGLGPVRFFAYPYGLNDRRVHEAVRRAGITAAFTTDPGVMDPRTDRMRIPRVEIGRRDEGARFLTRVLLARELGVLVPFVHRIHAGGRRGLRRGSRRLRRVLTARSPTGARRPADPSTECSAKSPEPPVAGGGQAAG